MENKEYKHKEFDSGQKPFADIFTKMSKELANTTTNTTTSELTPAPAPVKTAVKTEELPSIEEVESIEAKLVAAVEKAAKKEVYLKKISCYMADLVANAVRVNSMTNLEKEELMDDIHQNHERIMQHLAPQAQPDKTGRLPLFVWKARVAFAEAMIASATTKTSLFDVIEGSKFHKLPGLIKLGIMEYQSEEKKNAVLIEVFGQTYQINGSRGEAERLKNLFVTTISRIKTAGAAYYAKLRDDLDKNVSIHDDPCRIYIPGTKGSTVLDVPFVEKGQRMPGGSMWVESNGENIQVVAAIGYFQKTMQEIADAGISIPISSLKEERFGYKKGLSDQDNYYCQVLHNMLRRAKAALDEKAMRKESETPAEKAEHEALRKWLEDQKAVATPATTS